MTQYNKSIGRWGENIAANFLIKQGYKIVAKNVRTERGEIDIIARIGDVTVFVEVKTRTSNMLGYPEENITRSKAKHMLRCAEMYAAEHEIDHWQCDAIAIEGTRGMNPRITHFENVLA